MVFHTGILVLSTTCYCINLYRSTGLQYDDRQNINIEGKSLLHGVS